jgi:molecular chaperone DnaJ
MATLGGSVEVPTVEGKVKVTIAPGTQPGKVLRLRGKGLPSVNRYGTGDLLVNVGVYIPENLSKDEKALMEKLANSSNVKPNANASRDFFSRFRNMFE